MHVESFTLALFTQHNAFQVYPRCEARPQCVYPFTKDDGHFGGFWFLTVVNKAFVNFLA